MELHRKRNGMMQLTLVVGTVLIAAISGVPTAQARVDDPFKPELFVPTTPIEPDPTWSFPGAHPNSTAGAHPDLVIGMRKPENACPDADGDGIPDQLCRAIDIHMEQNLKKLVVHLPPGLMTDFKATPYCVPEQRWSPVPAMSNSAGLELLAWFCDADSVVGTVKADIAACYRNLNLPEGEEGSAECHTGLNGDESILLRDWPGAVYNARPQPDEQGHLIVLVPNDPHTPEEGRIFSGGWFMIDFSVHVRRLDNGVDLIADGITDMLDIEMRNGDGNPLDRFQFSIQIARLDMALYGSTGEERGHPFLTNSFRCEPQSIDVMFQGYERNSVEPPGDLENPIPGSGDGKVVTNSAPYTVTGCGVPSYSQAFTGYAGAGPSDTLPDVPRFNVRLSDRRKGKKTAIELDLAAQKGDIKKVSFGLPRYMRFSTKHLGKKRSLGRLQIVTRKDKLKSSLRLRKIWRAKRKKKVIRFSTKGALSDLNMRLYEKKVRLKKKKLRTRKGGKKKQKIFKLERRFSLGALPYREINKLNLSLSSRKSRLIRNPKRCKRPLKFMAYVTTDEGKRHTLSKKIHLEGKGCALSNHRSQHEGYMRSAR